MSSSMPSTTRRSSPARARSALEMLEDAPDLDTIVVPIGGGGLMSGVAIAARAIKPDIELIGVEAELYPSMKCAIQGCDLPLGGDTLAEGIAVKQPGELTSRILRSLPTTSCWSPNATSSGRSRCWSGSRRRWSRGRAPPASPRCSPIPSASPARRSATVLCGGNIDTHLLANVLVRDLVRQGRIARLRVAAAGPPRRARRDHRQVPRSGRQHHRDQPQPDLHPAAGQGHGDRGRVRSPRRAGDRRCRRATRSRRLRRRTRCSTEAHFSLADTLLSLGGTVPRIPSILTRSNPFHRRLPVA